MKKIGQVLHTYFGNRVIAKVETPPKIGATIFDIRKKPIGVVLDIFGSVKSPYIEIKVKDQEAKKIINSPIYILSKGSEGKRRR
ncbi:MAG: Gar1/Naf1 family protein [Candidatus Bathyarchaeota archaeon]|nr:Gar1/Naf1 family protein [Candidatus Bathyarchaeota archaeon]